ncbi:MAG: transporter [Flavobacterium sp.]|nr:transporter [Flavobacterium sp.]
MRAKFLLSILVFSLSANAQNLTSIQTDRPDLTECPFIVPINYFQLENGFVYQQTNENNTTIVAPSILIKFGINNHFELRMVIEYELNNNYYSRASGINPVLFGFKSRLIEENGILPTTSFIGHLSVPKLATVNYKTAFSAPEFRFAMQHTISKNQTLSYNLGAEWDGESAEPTFIYTLTTGYSFSEKVSVYAELYGFLPQINPADHRFDGGFCYLLNPNNQLDISAGFGISKISPNYFVGLGYSFRFKT